MRRHDRLIWLGASHDILRRVEIGSVDAYRAASHEQRSGLHIFRQTIRELGIAAHPDVLLALWPPNDLNWSVAGVTSQPTVRLLDVNRGNVGGIGIKVLKMQYDVSNPSSEREAWRALFGTLRG